MSETDAMYEVPGSRLRELTESAMRSLALCRVLAERERELFGLKGPCSNARCRLHHAHSGPCDTAPPEAYATAEGGTEMDRAERVAEQFHETYERLAPDHGYRTREASAKPWADVPDTNKRLMVAVVEDLISRGVVKP